MLNIILFPFRVHHLFSCYLHQVFQRKKKAALLAALEKIKAGMHVPSFDQIICFNLLFTFFIFPNKLIFFHCVCTELQN